MIYVFRCEKCNATHEVEMKMSEYTAENHHCPDCDSLMIRDVQNYGINAQWHCDGAYGKSN